MANSGPSTKYDRRPRVGRVGGGAPGAAVSARAGRRVRCGAGGASVGGGEGPPADEAADHGPGEKDQVPQAGGFPVVLEESDVARQQRGAQVPQVAGKSELPV